VGEGEAPVKKPGVEKLREDSREHLRYEIQMMQDTLQRLLHDAGLHKDTVLKNAMVESCVVHARSLTGFIFPDDARTDDITSDDYVAEKLADWMAARGTIPSILVDAKIRTAKEIVHLTTKRLGADDPAKEWPLQEVVAALHVLLKKFVTHAAPDRLDREVAHFIAGLRPPIETATIKVYNPDSTGLATKTSFSTDVRTVAPIPPWPRPSTEEGEAQGQGRRHHRAPSQGESTW
jgi:hypothetical protein